MRSLLILLTLFISAACGDELNRSVSDADPSLLSTAPLPAVKTDDLPGFFDCVRETGGVLIASHRGGPLPGYPENALETLQYGFDQGLRVFEIDVVTSRDGMLFLLHDRSLGRTTTGNGSVADTDWAEIESLNLVDNNGDVTSFTAPRLTDILTWSVATGAVLELDKKETTGWRSLIRAVDTAGAQNNVILITYTDNDAALVQSLAPNMMFTASARGGRDIGKLEDAGVDRRYLIGWTGTREEDPAAWARLRNEGVEAAFGTLGRRGERLDDTYWEDGDPSEYKLLVENGITLLATDEPYRVAAAISEDDRALNACAN
ncbi:MAG: glycerophosphodiester phosphodiesterase family protein [Pseudomonadota bacterium]